jgi:hypothetical protein
MGHTSLLSIEEIADAVTACKSWVDISAKGAIKTIRAHLD